MMLKNHQGNLAILVRQHTNFRGATEWHFDYYAMNNFLHFSLSPYALSIYYKTGYAHRDYDIGGDMTFGLILFLYCTLYSCFLQAFHLDSTGTQFIAKRLGHYAPLEVGNFFEKKKFYLTTEQIITDPLALQQVAKDTLRYIKRHEATHIHTVDPVGFAAILSLQSVKNTLQFICQTVEEDKKTGRHRLLQQPFINKHFSSVAWRADTRAATYSNITLPDDNHIRLTTYAVFNMQGSRHKTEKYNCGLYALHDDTLAKRFTKQQIIAGALEHVSYLKKRTPLAWVTQQALEDALMHGTMLVAFPDDGSRLLNVHKNNGIAYDRSIKDRTEQRRYWFFKDIGTKTHEAASRIEKIKNRKDVIFAGDLHNIGFGKLIALRHENPQTRQLEMRLGILADTGSAFYNNLYQLDYFAGLAEGYDDLRHIIRQRPTFTKACILYKKG